MNKLAAFTVLLSLTQLSLAGECEPLPEKAEKFIKSFTENDRAAEYCRFRTILRGDINSDGAEDLIVIFNNEGGCGSDKNSHPGTCGNHSETYLKIFLGRDLSEVPVQMIGRRGERFIIGMKLVNGVLQVDTLSYGKDDPMCCPSVKAKTEFVLKGETIVEKHP